MESRSSIGFILYEDKQWREIRSAITEQFYSSERSSMVNDQYYLQKQTELMEEIREKLSRAKARQSFGSMEILPIDSSISNISSAYNFDNDESLLKNKFTQEFETSLVSSALKQVKNSCSEQTYETVRNYLLNNKQKQCEMYVKQLEKKSKQNSELSLSLILKQKQLQNLKEELNPIMQKFESLQEEKRKWKKKNDQIAQKQKRVHKTEMALIFKEKVHQEAKKKGDRLKEFYNLVELKMKRICDQLQKIWENILSHMNKIQNEQCCQQFSAKACWKKQVMKKCKDKLLEQRNLLKQQSKQLQKEYQIIDSISQQFKKLINDQQEGFSSCPSGMSNSSINLNLNVIGHGNCNVNADANLINSSDSAKK